MIYKVLVKKPEIYKEVVVNDYGEESTVERVRWREEWKRVEREMTAEEIAEMEAKQPEMPEPEPTLEERLSMMEDAFAELRMQVPGMAKFWANRIKQGRASIDDVPERWREEVKSLLN